LKTLRNTEKNILVTERQLSSSKEIRRERILKKILSWLRKKTNPLTKPVRIRSEKTVKARTKARNKRKYLLHRAQEIF
jgi:hypothetical protein